MERSLHNGFPTAADAKTKDAVESAFSLFTVASEVRRKLIQISLFRSQLPWLPISFCHARQLVQTLGLVVEKREKEMWIVI